MLVSNQRRTNIILILTEFSVYEAFFFGGGRDLLYGYGVTCLTEIKIYLFFFSVYALYLRK